MNLCKEIKLTKIKAASTSAATEVVSDVVDMQGYEGVMFVTTIATANAGNYLCAEQATVAEMTDAEALAGTKVVAAANGQTVWLDIYKPTKRYLTANVIRTSATVVGEIYALQYGGRVKPETNVIDNTIIGELHISPDEGTV